MGNGSSRARVPRTPRVNGNQPGSDNNNVTTVSFNYDFGRWAVRNIPTDEEPRSPSPPPNATQLKVLSIDLKSEINAVEHHTDEIDGVKALVIRRGQAFILRINFNRQYNASTDRVTFDFKTGPSPRFPKRTRVFAEINSSLRGKGWDAEVTEVIENSLTVSITTSPDALIGKYSLAVRTNVADGPSTVQPSRYVESIPIYLLFNAWCEADQVFLGKEVEKEEYVLNERGFIWYGNWRQLGKRPWSFNQFEKSVFEAVMYLLKKHVKEAALGSATLIARSMSAAVNSQDDNGVLSGRWDGKYAPHSRPTKWTGSQAILEKHFETKAPVCYGQCWVFSGVLTTVLRCLGIPTRSVTNFASAHDTDSSLTIDKHFDQDGESVSYLNSDSVWNFHVWNEVWMTRNDLPEGFGGWQVVDSTPQETSEGIFCTGPCPVSAIKQGQVFHGYDAKFVFAEVNGDIIHWKVNRHGENELMSIKKHHLGQKISTKKVGSNERHDLTGDYKHQEGSDAERTAVELATTHGSKPYLYEKLKNKEDVEMGMKLHDDNIGDDFDIEVNVANTSQEERTVTLTVLVHACYYTGVIAAMVKKVKKVLKFGPKESTVENIHVAATDYLDKLVDQTAFKVSLFGHVDETGQDYADEEDLRLRTPDLEVKLISPAADEVHVGDHLQVEISLKNPLKKALTDSEFDIEGRGLLSYTTVTIGVIPPKKSVRKTIKVYPFRTGKRTLIITFESNELTQVTGELELNVQKRR